MGFLRARRNASAVFAIIASLSAVCPFVRHKSVYDWDSSFTTQKISTKFQWDYPQRGRQICVCWPVEKSSAQTYSRKFASIRHGDPPPRRCASRGRRCVINNFDDSRTSCYCIRRWLCDPIYSHSVRTPTCGELTNGQTDGRTQGHSIYRASIASRGKQIRLKQPYCRLNWLWSPRLHDGRSYSVDE